MTLKLSLPALILLAVAPVRHEAAFLYTAQRTPDQIPSNPRFWQGKDLNDSNEIAGFYFETSTLSGRYYVSGSEYALGLTGGHYSWSMLHGLNNKRFAVGQEMLPWWIDESFAVRAVIVHPDRAQHPDRYLGSLTGPDGDSNGIDLNDSNIVVGESKTTNGATHAVRFNLDGTVTDLGTLGGTNSSAVSINNRGDIVGSALNAAGHWRAFLIPSGGSMLDLGTLGGKESRAHRINNRGEIVGEAQTAAGATRAFLYSDGQMQDLGVVHGTNSVAYGINDHGVIVGSSGNAFVKFPGHPITDLAKLVRARRDEWVQGGLAINNRGVILARVNSGFTVTYTWLLKPGHLATELTNGTYHLKFSAPPGTRARLERATSLASWTSVSTNTATSTEMTYTEPASSMKFFRAVITP